MLQVRTYVAPSAIHGRGLFAADPIAQGESVWMYTDGADLVIPAELAGEMCRPEFLDMFGHWCRVNVMVCVDDARYINHSDMPNLTSWAPGGLCIAHRAARDIAAGEELTVDYRIGDDDPWRGFNKEEAKHESTGGTSSPGGHAGMADHGQLADGRDHAEH